MLYVWEAGQIWIETIYFYVCPLGKPQKIKSSFFNGPALTTYQNMDISRLSLSVGIFTGLLQYFPKNRAILVQKLSKKNCQNPFPAI